ncbi:MAG: OmpP1/FadL family transporter [Sandaracinaceae bacterium]
MRGVSSRLALFALVGAALTPASARAGNGDGVLVGNDAAISAGAVSAVVSDGSSTWYNPAGLASAERSAVDMNGSAISLRASEEGGLIRATTGESNDGGYLEFVSVPSAVTLARQLEPGLTVAFGVFASRFGQNTTRTSLNTDTGPNTARWTLSSSEFRATYHAGGAIGVQVADQLRFGISLFGVYQERSDSFQTAGAFDLGGDTTRLNARGGISQVRSFGAELGVGVQWEPNPGVLIAFTARSPGLELLTQLRSTTTQINAEVSDLDLDLVDFTPEDDERLAPGIAVLTAGRFNLAFAYRFRRGWIAVEVDVQPPLELDPVLRRRLVWNARVGGRYRVDDQLSIGGGFFTDISEGRPIRELGETQVDFYGLTAGFEFRTPHSLGPDEDVDTIVFSTTAALRYAVGVGEVGGLLFDPNQGTRRDTVPVGTTIHEVGLHLGSALYF